MDELKVYTPFIDEIKALIHEKQMNVLRTMNSETIGLYWSIGSEIARRQEENGWGKSVVEVLADELQQEFYIQMAIRHGWTKRALTNHIENQTYEKYLTNQTNFDITLPEERRTQAKLAVKDEYTFDFAELSPEYLEHELELELVGHVREFLIEMGGDFAFIENQYHLKVGERDFWLDLLLFHRRLRCLVAIELKIGDFEAEYAGKMQM